MSRYILVALGTGNLGALILVILFVHIGQFLSASAKASPKPSGTNPSILTQVRLRQTFEEV
jgi:hypothetical protein